MKHSNSNDPTFQDQKGKDNKKRLKKLLKKRTFGQFLVGIWALLIATATGNNTSQIQWLERQGQTLFFQMRGNVATPEDIIIVAIDNYSMNHGKLYLKEQEKLAYLEPIYQFPWQRKAYGIVIKKILDSGAKVVAIDLIFDAPSSYGIEDDKQFHKVLKDYAGKVTLASVYEADDIRKGGLMNLFKPHDDLKTYPMSIGTINYPLEVDGKVHQFASKFTKIWSQNNQDIAQEFNELIAVYPSFPEAVLQASDISFNKNKGDFIHFYGIAKSFHYISFVDIIDQENWQSYLQNGAVFQDKIVLIGATAEVFQDFHRTPIDEKMPGIEIHANAIASLKEGNMISIGIEAPILQGFVVFIGIMGTSLLFLLSKRWWTHLSISLGISLTWIVISYLSFIYGYIIFPTIIPVIGILAVGLVYTIYGSLKEVFNWLAVRQTFKHYASSPIVREIILSQDDLQDILEEKQAEVLNRKLGGRYQILKELSEGGFGKTYIAQDLQRPGMPKCVVKKLQPISDNPKHWKLAKRLFITEADVLEKLGNHEQIPQLLAYFDDGEDFYLVQELIIGEPLSKELSRFLDGSVKIAINILEELLPILDFIHSQGVIHRDLKPPNVIRRKSDDKLVLIDFGTVKELSEKFLNVLKTTDEQQKFTIAIGTKGYTPPEQAVGKPRFNSDIFALGMIAIEALTLVHPSLIDEDHDTNKLLWEDNVEIDLEPQLIAIINKMISQDFKERYQTAKEVLKDIQKYKKQFGSSFLKRKRFSSLKQNNNYYYNSAEINASELSTHIPNNDIHLTDITTEMPSNDINFNDLPTEIPSNNINFTDLPTEIPSNDKTINKQNN